MMRCACRLVMLLLADACHSLLPAEHACNIFAKVFRSDSHLSFGWGCSTVALRLHCRARESPSSKLSTMVSHCRLNASGAHILSGLRFVRWQICSTSAGHCSWRCHAEIWGSAQRCNLSLQAQDFSKIMAVLFRQVARCLNSSHFQVCTGPAHLDSPTSISMHDYNKGQHAPSHAAPEPRIRPAFEACQYCRAANGHSQMLRLCMTAQQLEVHAALCLHAPKLWQRMRMCGQTCR